MEAIRLAELAQAVGGVLLGDCGDPEILITGATSDNRKTAPGDVFFAYVGENTDGHKYVKAALEAGAAGCVISKDPGEYVPGKFYVLVEDTILAAGDLARYYRAGFDIPVIAVTGSVGKTTTKDMIAAVLSRKFNVLKTEGNFNNNIGLPRTLLRIDSKTEIAVVEMGMNHLGEISYLTGIGRPTAAVITNIGEAHIGNLGSKENIFKAKCEIFEGLREGGLAVLNGDDEFLVRLREDPEMLQKCELAYVGEAEDADYRALDLRQEKEDETVFTAVTPENGSYQVRVPAVGQHFIYPVLTACALGTYFGMTPQEIQEGIQQYIPTKMRMEMIHCDGNILIYNDTYNANPQSMKAGLQILSKAADRKKVAVLGDMFELGEASERLHREVGACAAQMGLDALVAVGEACAFMADEAVKGGMKNVFACGTKEEAKKVLKDLIAPDTAFLCKASRGMALEELAAFIRENA